MDQRLVNEINHGQKLVGSSEKLWYWETPAGKLRWKRRADLLTAPVATNMLVLEIGCGPGYLTKELNKKQAKIFAVDISKHLLEVVKKNLQGCGVVFSLQNAYDLGLRDNLFDIIVGSSVLHHLELDKALTEFYRVLKPGGSIHFAEPNMLNPQIAIQKKFPLVKRLMGDSPDETAFFRWQLSRKIEEYGFVDIEIKTFDFLHPNTPGFLISFMERLGGILESLPFISEIAGSLYIEAKKR